MVSYLNTIQQGVIMINNSIPWTEKYRPSEYTKIILDNNNQNIFNTIIETGEFPNLLLYGPPGTGKTTTIMNITKLYLETHYTYGPELIVHLNASDDRGIDIIRNQIHIFSKTNVLFNKGVKFIILDEADYMTKNAQQSLRTIIIQNIPNIRFCIICNYISKIEHSLKNEFISLRFNNLPKSPIEKLLYSICEKENIDSINNNYIKRVQEKFNSDIRSMINYIQINHKSSYNVLDTKQHYLSKTYDSILSQKNPREIYTDITDICNSTNIPIQEYFIDLCKHVLLHHDDNKNEIYKIVLYVTHTFRVDVYTRLQLFLYKLFSIVQQGSVC